jgi:predicted negative regulator of RcsB-dependent stress response
LLVRTQKTPDIFWNQFLSWFYVQQKEYDKAFVQERAIYKRNPETFYEIVTLAQLAIEDNQDETAKTILAFVLENTNDVGLQMQAHHFLMQLKIENATAKDYPQIQLELQELVKKFGVSPYSLKLQLLLANFEAFYQNQPKNAMEQLQRTLELPLNLREAATVKMQLADIMVYDEKFNQALLFYAQIEESLKNDPIGHEASFKVAQTTYFKGDFEWALTQLKVLKSSDTQLIANDALELFLIINDYTEEDSTQTALKGLARADYLLYKNKPREAKELLNSLIKNHPEEAIQEVILLRLGNTSEKLNEFDQALVFYQKIIDEHPESIYKDEALYFSGNIYWKEFEKPDEAKKCFEIMLLNHQDSIYYIEARKKLRLIRGDTNI